VLNRRKRYAAFSPKSRRMPLEERAKREKQGRTGDEE